MNWIISYPRSGNSLIRFCVERITQMKTLDYGRYDKISNLNLANKQTILTKEHDATKVRNISKLILLIRNYRDVFISQELRNETSYEPMYICDKFFEQSTFPKNNPKRGWFFFDYLHLIKFYENCDKPKMIIYYEDLIEDKMTNIKKVIQFFTNEDYDINPEELDRYMIQSHEQYIKKTGTMTQKISNIEFTKEQLEYIDNLMYNYNPDIYDKYLIRYKN